MKVDRALDRFYPCVSCHARPLCAIPQHMRTSGRGGSRGGGDEDSPSKSTGRSSASATAAVYGPWWRPTMVSDTALAVGGRVYVCGSRGKRGPYLPHFDPSYYPTHTGLVPLRAAGAGTGARFRESHAQQPGARARLKQIHMYIDGAPPNGDE